jgi:predicted esterase
MISQVSALALACSLLLAAPTITGSPAPEPSPIVQAPAGEKPRDAPRAPLPAAEARKLRGLFTEALARNDGKTRAALLAQGKKLATKHAFADLREALRAGPLLDPKSREGRKQGKESEKLGQFGTTRVGYTFECEEGQFRYAVDCPEKYDAERPCAVLLDPGHGTGAGKSDAEKADFLPFFRGQCESAGLENWLVVRTEIVEQVGADGLRGALPEDRVARIFEALWRDLATRYAIDPDRLYVSGLSQTGFWSWYLGRARPDRYAGIAPMSAVTWQVNKYAANFSTLGVFVLHGADDKVCPVGQPRATCAEFERLGYPLKYVEVQGSAHDVKTWGRLHEALEWLAPRERAKYAKVRTMHFTTLANPWCGALRVDELARPGDGKAATAPTAWVTVEFKGQQVLLKSEGVRGATLCLTPELVDLAQPVEVVWNENRVWQKLAEPAVEELLELAVDRADWKETFDCAIELRAP